MALVTESIIEDTALAWFEGLGYEIIHGPDITPGEPGAERDSYADTLLVSRLQ